MQGITNEFWKNGFPIAIDPSTGTIAIPNEMGDIKWIHIEELKDFYQKGT